jgi:riboflavin synthase
LKEVLMMAEKIGIVDTMFSRVNMGGIAIGEFVKNYPEMEVVRTTVPGVKDLAVECKKLLDSGCGVCMALGMVGGAPVDAQCAHEASLGIQQAKLLTGKHIIEVFVHENEAWSGKEFLEICEDRVRKHAHNAALLLKDPQALVKRAGMGVRQGKEDEGPVDMGDSVGIALVVAEFNKGIADSMERDARDEAGKLGADVRTVVRVPGAFEIPLAVKKALWDKKVHGVAALGYVKKGETKHDSIISKTIANALMGLSLESRKPVALGVITVADAKQAEERREDYARRAVQAAVRMARELRK